MRKLSVVCGAFVTGALVVAACSGGGAATIPPVNVPSSLPSFAIPSLSIPSISIPTLPAGSGEAGSHADPALESRYPQQIGTMQRSSVDSYKLGDLVQLIAADDQTRASAFLTAVTGAGLDPNSITFGSAYYTGDDGSTSVDTVHTPGADASKFAGLWPQLAILDNPDDPAPTVANQTVGGKNVVVMTESDGTTTYIYPQGEVVWSFTSSDPEEAATILPALP